MSPPDSLNARSRRSPAMLTSDSAAAAAAALPLFLPQATPRQDLGPDPRLNLAGTTARAGASDRQPLSAFRHGNRVLRHRCRRAPGCGKTPTTPWKRRRFCSCANSARPCAHRPAPAAAHARYADATCRTSAIPHATFGRIRAPPAIFDADRARLRRRRSGSA